MRNLQKILNKHSIIKTWRECYKITEILFPNRLLLSFFKCLERFFARLPALLCNSLGIAKIQDSFTSVRIPSFSFFRQSFDSQSARKSDRPASLPLPPPVLRFCSCPGFASAWGTWMPEESARRKQSGSVRTSKPQLSSSKNCRVLAQRGSTDGRLHERHNKWVQASPGTGTNHHSNVKLSKTKMIDGS